MQVVYGGADIRRQIKNLKSHPQIIVGTPGRLLDHIRRHTIKLENVQTLVLDEADDMLDMDSCLISNLSFQKHHLVVRLYCSQQQCHQL